MESWHLGGRAESWHGVMTFMAEEMHQHVVKGAKCTRIVFACFHALVLTMTSEESVFPCRLWRRIRILFQSHFFAAYHYVLTRVCQHGSYRPIVLFTPPMHSVPSVDIDNLFRRLLHLHRWSFRLRWRLFRLRWRLFRLRWRIKFDGTKEPMSHMWHI